MRLFLFSAGVACALVFSAAQAQTPPGNSGNIPQIPFGQTYKDFQFPLYQNGQLSAMLSAISAKGLTLNRAEATDLKIELYTQGKVTTTITSPKADLLIADHKMRTKNTVEIDRADMVATAQTCDFDLTNKKYLLRENVKVVLKNFDAGVMPKNTAAPKTKPMATFPSPAPAPTPTPADDASMPLNPRASSGESLLDFPGASAGTNAAPTPNP